jgi:hypothetical protein
MRVLIFWNSQGREMVSGDTLNPVGTTQAFYGLGAAGGNRIGAGLRGGEWGGQRGVVQMSPQGGLA